MAGHSFCVLWLLVTLLSTCRGMIQLNGVFTDHMVLQRDHAGLPPVRIFGLAYTNETIVIEWGDGSVGPWNLRPETTGAAHWPRPLGMPWGNWSVNFTAPTNPGPHTITIRSRENRSDVTVLRDVMFGEVLFCAGQSNMKLTVSATDDAAVEYARARALGARVRVNFIGGNLSLDGPQITPNAGNWTVGAGDNGTAIKDFSAICWDHGALIAEWLAASGASSPVIGLVEVSVGGTTIHHWIPQDEGIACNRTGLLPSSGECTKYPPGWIYNGRMNPMLLDGNGFSAREVLYYQGEADSGENDHYSKAAYECELRGLVTGYRRAFGQPAMPIVVVQLPGVTGTTGFQHDNDTALGGPLAQGWSAIQAAQQDVARSEVNVGLVTDLDFGCCGLHYPHKFPVAARAANISRQLVFGDTAIDNMAPVVDTVVHNPTGTLTVDIHFNNTNGLMLKPTYHCNATYDGHAHGEVPNVKTIAGVDGNVNVTCCASSPVGHEGIGIVKLAVETSKHPPHYWGGWVPADLKIVSDSLVTATAFLPPGVVATAVTMVDLNLGGMGCTLANRNNQPLGVVTVTPMALPTAPGPAPSPGPSPTPPGPPPQPPASNFCACDVCDDENPLPPADHRIRIAAVGDSITRGHPLKGKDLRFNYPCTLQRALGAGKYVVFNFGAGGHTMLKASPPLLPANKSYWNSTQFSKAVAVKPHIVLVMLGTNDAVGPVWKELGGDYPVDYAAMIAAFRALATAPAIHTMTCPPLYNGNFAGINQTVVNRVLPGLVARVATRATLPTAIPIFEGMGGTGLTHHDWFWGNGSYGCHPNMQGYQALAGIVHRNLPPSTMWVS